MKNRIPFLQVVILLISLAAVLCGCAFGGNNRVKETDEVTFGIDVAKYQGTIDWQTVSQSGVDFAMVRVGYRTMTDGIITPDSNGRYNLQEAQKYGIPLGAYFFSTAITEEEAVEEANWIADILDQYAITYPVVYDCEGFRDPDSRQYDLTKDARTDIALAFLRQIEKRGYEGMFYASKNELQGNAQWDTDRIEKKYKIWVAQYPSVPYPQTPESSYEGSHHMWQYTMDGSIAGISQPVDMNVAYFGYEGINEPMSTEPPEEVGPDVEALLNFQEVNEPVTAKVETNLRDIPSQDTDSNVLYTLMNGEVATRIAISDSGWSKVVYNGNIYYAVSSYLTTDLNYDPNAVPVPEDDDGIKTEFTPVNDRVTAKEVVNLRTLPSVTHEDSTVVVQLVNGTVITRTGINEDVGWSRVEYNGQILYCVSSYLTVVEE